MNKVYKKMVSTALALFLIGSVSTSFAQGESVSLFDLQNTMLENNKEIVNLAERVSRESNDYRTAVAFSKAIDPKIYDDEDTDDYDMKTKEILNPLKAEKEYKDMLFELEELKSSKINELEYDFYSLIYAMDSYDSLTESFSLMKTEYAQMEKKLELGLITEGDFKSFKKNYLQTHLNLVEATNKVSKLKREINIIIGKNVSDDINVQRKSFNSDQYVIEDIDALVKTTIDTSYEMKALELQKAIYEKELELKNKFSGFTSYKLEIETLQDNFKDMDKKIEDMKRDLEYQIKTGYNNVTIAYENYQIAQIELEIAVRDYNESKVKFGQGLISQTDYDKSLNSLEQSQDKFNESKLSYYKEKDDFVTYLTLRNQELK